MNKAELNWFEEHARAEAIILIIGLQKKNLDRGNVTRIEASFN